MVVHLQYPAETGFYTWGELECLAHVLGFKNDLFCKNFPASVQDHKHRLKTEVLLDTITKRPYFGDALEKTVNIHPTGWNIAVILKCISLLDLKLVTFSDIYSVRISYQFYENADSRGLATDETTLLNAIKMSGRMISPMKLVHRVKHMIPNLEDSERLQLHEFFDLLLWCEPYDTSIARDITLPNGNVKDGVGCYPMVNFDDLVRHVDQRIARELDDRYCVEELSFARRRRQNPVHSPERNKTSESGPKKLLRNDKQFYQKMAMGESELRNAIKQSENLVRRARTGHIRDASERSLSRGSVRADFPFKVTTTVTAESPSNGVRSDSTTSTYPPLPTVRDVINSWMGPLSSTRSRHFSAHRVVSNASLERRSASCRRVVSPQLITRLDRDQTASSMRSTLFASETLESKYTCILDQNMSDYLPHYGLNRAGRSMTAMM